ncbi:hypothetical protein KQ44_06970 [Brachyspira sp. G79]|nr:hypothetical protein [Brachyspira sp. G79]PCG19800.1 hypothetical protein KQ44_06970 [Brachyspira sp. G79]
MNKKILTLFLVVAASAILAVSCNNKTTNPVKENTGSTTTTTPTGGETTTTPTDKDPTTTPTDGKEETQKKTFKSLTADPDGTKEESALKIVVGDAATTADEKKANLKITATGADDDKSFKAESVKYTITGFDNIEAKEKANEEKLSALTKDSFAFNGTELSIPNKTKLGDSGLSGNDKFDLVKLTITASVEGYNDQTIDIYVKLAKQ